jgi:hypothetical protein
MKKLLFLSIAALFSLVSAHVFGQSTGSKPAPGATHNYSITPGSGTNTITWWVTKGDLVTTTTNAVISNSSASSTDITWATGVIPGDWYYVHVLEENQQTSCSNQKVLPVQIIASPFYLTLAANAQNQCYDGAVSVSIDSNDPSVIKYDHGKATVKFTVTPSGLTNSYSGYSFSIALAFGGYTGLDASNVSVSSNASISNGTVTVSDNEAVTITYEVKNTNIFNNGAAVDAQDFTATATISGGIAKNGVSDNGNTAHNDATNVARPHTSGIQFN